MKYGLLEYGYIIQSEDEFYSESGWEKVDKSIVGFIYDAACLPMRRLIERSNWLKPIEVFTVPFGTWAGCTGEVFMDGTSKKVRLNNVFYGAKPLVIDFPVRKMRGNNIVLEEDDVIQSGDQFSYTGGFMDCESTVGMKVKDARNEFSSPVTFVRPIS
jgi:hypothetical protein